MVALWSMFALGAFPQAPPPPTPTLSRQIESLNQAVARLQAQMEQSQRQLEALRDQLNQLRRQAAVAGARPTMPSPPGSTQVSPAVNSPDSAAASIQDLRERQTMQAAEIATQEQAKVESASRYPVQLSGLVLFNSFVNTGGTDIAATPTLALPGAGSSGASMRQTVLGINARGPHWLGAASSADLSVDFDGNPAADGALPPAPYASAGATLLRLRTAHARLQWQRTEIYVALDRPLLSPDSPTSLTAVAVPALAGSGNLWKWNPQVGITRDTGPESDTGFRFQAALIDVADATPAPPSYASAPMTPGGAAAGRWPGLEGRIELHGPVINSILGRDHIGAGAYYAQHFSSLLDQGYNSWAGTLDARLLLPGRLQWTGSFYRGRALGGLGGGAYKDIAYAFDGAGYRFRPLDAVGGWAQLKEKTSERLQFNAAFGLDDAFAHELRPFAVAGGSVYQNLTRNRTISGNVIYSPSAYLLFSLEYRYLTSYGILGPSAISQVVGLGAGYRF